MSFLAFTSLVFGIDALLLIGCIAWDRRHKNQFGDVDLGSILALGLVSSIPIIQLVLCGICVCYILFHITPNVVLFKQPPGSH